MNTKQRIIRYRLRTRRRFRKYEKRFRHHPRLLLVASLLSAGAVVFILVITLRDNTLRVNPRQANIVILHADGKTSAVPTREQTVGNFLNKAGVSIRPGDVVEPSLDTMIQDDDFRVNVYRAAPVTIIDEGKRINALSAGQTPRTITIQAGVSLYAEDIIKTTPSQNFLKDGVGSTVTIERATPAVLNLYGTALPLRTHARTVGELLSEKKVQLAADDTVQPAKDTELTSQTQVFVTRYGTQVASEEESIGFETQTVEDASLSFGTQVLRQVGAAGKKSVTYQLSLKNGAVVGKTKIQEVIIQEAVPQVTARGKAVSIPSDKEAIMRAAGIAASDFPYVQYILNRENALWCPTRWQGQNFCPSYYQEKYPGAESDTSLGYGMCQSTPANKMAANGADWRTNPSTQLRWCSGYATSRYGSWQGAYEAWSRRAAAGHGWW